MSARFKRQLNTELGLTPPIDLSLMGLRFTSWHYAHSMAMEELALYEPKLPRGALVLASALSSDLPVRQRANLIASLPYDVFNYLLEAYRPFYADYDGLYRYVTKNSQRLTYILEVANPPTNFFVSAAKDLVRTAQGSEQMKQLERILGVRWTPDMLYPQPTEDGIIRKTNEFWQPLAAILHSNPAGLLKGIKQSVSRVGPEADEEIPTVKPASAEGGKIPKGTKTEPKEIVIRRFGETFTSLREMPKDAFKELFYGVDLNPKR